MRGEVGAVESHETQRQRRCWIGGRRAKKSPPPLAIPLLSPSLPSYLSLSCCLPPIRRPARVTSLAFASHEPLRTEWSSVGWPLSFGSVRFNSVLNPPKVDSSDSNVNLKYVMFKTIKVNNNI